ERGKNELLTTNKSVQTIAKEIGFDDSGYFIKVFKGEVGCTPSAFRDLNSF
ncbi:MAG: AraC family transcriptional regulator, partial [Eubacteriales bacterium]|nr:AraC family transcriptional regulator [Eubacteriales bacterium]